jgi:hypothetical protein
MQITIQLRTDNAAFEGEGAGREVARIFRKLADKIEDWPGKNEFSLGLYDINGNKVGTVETDE